MSSNNTANTNEKSAAAAGGENKPSGGYGEHRRGGQSGYLGGGRGNRGGASRGGQGQRGSYGNRGGRGNYGASGYGQNRRDGEGGEGEGRGGRGGRGGAGYYGRGGHRDQNNQDNAGKEKTQVAVSGVRTENRFENLSIPKQEDTRKASTSLTKKKHYERSNQDKSQSIASQKFDALFGGGEEAPANTVETKIAESLAPAETNSRKLSNVERPYSRKQSNVSSQNNVDRKLSAFFKEAEVDGAIIETLEAEESTPVAP